jgi:hypothetical protein
LPHFRCPQKRQQQQQATTSYNNNNEQQQRECAPQPQRSGALAKPWSTSAAAAVGKLQKAFLFFYTF